jgi:hypothetical protein
MRAFFSKKMPSPIGGVTAAVVPEGVFRERLPSAHSQPSAIFARFSPARPTGARAAVNNSSAFARERPSVTVELNLKLRNRILTCLLACLTAFAGLAAGVASAQTEATPTVQKGKGTLATFVIYRNAAGELTCREATTAERQRITEVKPGDDLHLIYSGAPTKRGVIDNPETLSPGASVAGLDLQPSAGLHIFLHGTAQLEANPAAKNAFIVAANRWEALISTPINIVLDVDYGANWFGTPYPSADIIGQTGSRQIATGFSGVRQRLIANSPTAAELQLYNALPASTVPVELDGTNVATSSVVMTRANARALGFVPNIALPDSVASGSGDAKIGFNSAFPFDFTPDDGITSGQTDFDSVVTHEIGHALGFVSDAGGGTASDVTMWDIFRFRPGTANLGTIATAPRVMSKGGAQVYFNNQASTFGTQELSLSTGGPDPGPTDGDGRQSSHWKDDALVVGRPYIGIMDPTIGFGVRRIITGNDVKALDSFGYSVGGSVQPPPPAPPAPANDNFVNPVVIQGQNGSVAGTNQNATKETGEPDHAQDPGGSSVWYRWTAPATGQATFDTVGSNYDSTLAAYAGASVGGLSVLAQNDDIDLGVNVQSRITFPATAGVTYQIAVDGFDGATGSITLNWTSTGTVPTPTPTPTPVPTPTPTPTPVPVPQVFKVVGRVTDSNGNGIGGVRIGIAGPALANGLQYPAYTTASDGSYTVPNLTVGITYAIAPIRDGQFIFSPGAAAFDGAGGGSVGDGIANFTVSPGNPIDGSSSFVSQHYQDFLGRQPDASGLQFWTSEIENCQGNLSCREVKRINVSAAFFLSIEFQETGYLVERMYKVAYGDLTEASTGLVVPIITRQEFLTDTPLISAGVVVGGNGWQTQLDNNKNAYAQTFVQRSRFANAYPAGMTPLAFVAKLNQNTGGALTQAQVDALVAELSANNTNAGRASVLREVAENAEVDSREKNRAFVLMEFYGYLRRNPNDAPNTPLDFSGYNFWLSKLNQFGGNFVRAEMVKAFLDSTEYRQRFGQ